VLEFFPIVRGRPPLRSEAVNLGLSAFNQCSVHLILHQFVHLILHQFVKQDAKVIDSPFLKIFESSNIQSLDNSSAKHFRLFSPSRISRNWFCSSPRPVPMSLRLEALNSQQSMSIGQSIIRQGLKCGVHRLRQFCLLLKFTVIPTCEVIVGKH
jgi:hypothetical protein